MKPFKFHIGLKVSDISQTVEFYKQLFGQDPVKVKEDYAKFDLDNPGLVISFNESERVSSHFGHLGIRVNSKEELVERKNKIEQHLKITLEEENTSCCYAYQDKFWVTDPDGYEWEVYHFLKDDDKPGGREKLAEGKELASCC